MNRLAIAGHDKIRQNIFWTKTSSVQLTEALNLLNHENSKIVLKAVQTLREIKDIRALEPLRMLLKHPDLEVVNEVILSIGSLGDERVISDLIPFLYSDPLFQTSAIQALKEIRSQSAIAYLEQLLTDSIVGPMVAETIAFIGGIAAYKVLAKHWLKFRGQLDTENYLSLLKYVLEGINSQIPSISGICESFSIYLNDPNDSIRTLAACCILASGPYPEDTKALNIISETYKDYIQLPACLKNRRDLIPKLLNGNEKLISWGFQLSALYPKNISPLNILNALKKYTDESDDINYIAEVLLKIKDPILAPAILDLYCKIPWHKRIILHPVIKTYKKQIRSLLIDYDIDDETRIVISAYIGVSPVCIALEIMDLPLDSRILVLSLLTDCKGIMKCMPWSQWLENSPGFYLNVATEVALKSGIKEIFPVLRKVLPSYPVKRLIKSAGTLKDKESVSILIKHLESESTEIRMLILESLGHIGGKEARQGLKNFIKNCTKNEELRKAIRSLSLCATSEDCSFFREFSSNSDWYFRLICAEVLSRYPSPENFEILVKLSSDPEKIVSQRTSFFLKYLPMGNFLTCKDRNTLDSKYQNIQAIAMHKIESYKYNHQLKEHQDVTGN